MRPAVLWPEELRLVEQTTVLELFDRFIDELFFVDYAEEECSQNAHGHK